MEFMQVWGPVVKDWAPLGAVILTFINIGFLTFQVLRQNKISKAQLLKDRFEMYWKIYDSISDDEIKLVHACPDDFMPRATYVKFKDNDGVLRKYALMSELVEYLAFTHELKNYGIEDTFGSDWVKLWTRDLKEIPEFMEIMEYYKEYYPKFAKFADAIPSAVRAAALHNPVAS
jgi:hypothetical protein